MKRRANMAAGLLHRPKLLVLDEPTVGVDPQSRNAILETVGRLGIAVLYTTHYMEEAAKLCDRIGIIDDGHLIAEGTADALIAAHGGRDKVHLSCDGASLDELAAACRELDNVHDVARGGRQPRADDGPRPGRPPRGGRRGQPATASTSPASRCARPTSKTSS